jgi:hypothetical protein
LACPNQNCQGERQCGDKGDQQQPNQSTQFNCERYPECTSKDVELLNLFFCVSASPFRRSGVMCIEALVHVRRRQRLFFCLACPYLSASESLHMMHMHLHPAAHVVLLLTLFVQAARDSRGDGRKINPPCLSDSLCTYVQPTYNWPRARHDPENVSCPTNCLCMHVCLTVPVEVVSFNLPAAFGACMRKSCRAPWAA